MKNRAVMLREKAITAEAVKLPPGATTGMAIHPQMVQPQPAAIVTFGVGTKMHRGIHGTGAAMGGGMGLGRTGGGRTVSPISCPHNAQWGLCVRPTNGLGSLERLRLGVMGPVGLLGHPTGWGRPEVGQHDAQPDQEQDHQLIVDEGGYHGISPYMVEKEDHFTQFAGHRHYQQRSGTRPFIDGRIVNQKE